MYKPESITSAHDNYALIEYMHMEILQGLNIGYCLFRYVRRLQKYVQLVKPVYNDHLMGYFSAFSSSSRWPRAT